MLRKLTHEEKQEEGKDNFEDNSAMRGPGLEFLPHVRPVSEVKKKEKEENKTDYRGSDYNLLTEDANRAVQNSSDNSQLRMSRQAMLKRRLSIASWNEEKMMEKRKKSLIAHSSLTMSLAKLKMIEHFED